eukprot:SAG31_NODE_28088_length_415_cov_1.458861_1_plen_45_part_10
MEAVTNGRGQFCARQVQGGAGEIERETEEEVIFRKFAAFIAFKLT